MKQRMVFKRGLQKVALAGAARLLVVGLLVAGLLVAGAQRPLWALSDREEEALGVETSHMVEMMGGVLPESHPMSQRVAKIGKRFAALAQKREFPLRYRVLDNAQILNAFAAPGGTIYITSRLVKFARSEDELASILGHETAHVSQRHIAQEVEDRDAFVRFGARLQQLRREAAQASRLASANPKTRSKMTQSSSARRQGSGNRAVGRLDGGSPWANITWFLVSRGKARGLETEADTLSARWMKRLGYNPRAAITLLQHAYNTAPRSASPLSSLLSSHPGVEHRVRDLRALIEREKLDLVRKASKAQATATRATADAAPGAASGAPLAP